MLTPSGDDPLTLSPEGAGWPSRPRPDLQYARPVSKDLDHLLRRAADADGLHRIDYRDAIAAHGPEAVRRLEPWLRDHRLAAFAVVTIRAAASHGALEAARVALRRARPLAAPSVQQDIDRALTTLLVAARASAPKPAHTPTGSPERALDELRVLVRGWREHGCPPQKAIEWRQPDWVAAFPRHGERLRQLPATLDRGDVRRVAADAVRGPIEAEFAFLVVKAWGEAGNGYGSSRALESLERTAEPGERLLKAAQTLRNRDALASYARLADDGDCRVFNLGPAFGTKYLYFCQPDGKHPKALIHDKNVAGWLHSHAGFPKWSAAWSLRRYSAYLTQMHSWAKDLGCQPEDVELCMFRSALGPTSQWKDG